MAGPALNLPRSIDGLPAALLRWMITALLLVGLPLLGVAAMGRDARVYLEFPPLTRYVTPAGFSGWVFGLFVAIDVALVFFIGGLLIKAYRKSKQAEAVRLSYFPVWGWLGMAIMLSGWLLAWTRFQWFAALQGHTFCLPWIGYIILVNALCIWRSGRCLITDAPGRFLLLIPVSAIFWWFFEYLNRFVQNWYYVGVDGFGPLAYTLFASLAFATVLPAVLSTQQLLLTFAPLDRGLHSVMPLQISRPRAAAAAALLVAAVGLALLGVLPDQLFALVWVAPLLIIVALQALAGRKTIFTPLGSGDWHMIVSAALAALICGFFWELWNVGSLARWVYAVPYLDCCHIFAMPLLGYGGYLPFGMECLVVGQMVMGAKVGAGIQAPGSETSADSFSGRINSL